MNGIEILMQEHQNILKVVKKMRQSAIEIMRGKEVDPSLFRAYIDFIRNYADKHHHGKEELILFKIMTEELGAPAEKLVRHGMLVEHDMGRLYVKNLEDAVSAYEESPSDESRVDIIANAISYGNLLGRHIDKEDNIVYTFAERELKPESMEKVEADTLLFEKEEADVKAFYEAWVDSLFS